MLVYLTRATTTYDDHRERLTSTELIAVNSAHVVAVRPAHDVWTVSAEGIALSRQTTCTVTLVGHPYLLGDRVIGTVEEITETLKGVRNG